MYKSAKRVASDALPKGQMPVVCSKKSTNFDNFSGLKKIWRKDYIWKDGDLLSKQGSEGGKILKDEVYEKGCRVTLEKCPNYYAITCGVFGAFCHTAFCGEKECGGLYEQIKNELQAFIDKETTEEEEIAFYRYFSEKY